MNKTLAVVAPVVAGAVAEVGSAVVLGSVTRVTARTQYRRRPHTLLESQFFTDD